MHHLDGSYNSKKGFASLLGVIFLSIVVLSAIVIGAILSIDINRSNRNTADATVVSGVLQSCAQYTLDQLKTTNLAYAGNESITIDGITCNISTISGTGNNNRILKILAFNSANITKKVQIDINTINPYYIINSWQEVPDFY